jgi:hypothetical protein
MLAEILPAEPLTALNWEDARLKAVIKRQRRFAKQLDRSRLDPGNTLDLVERLERCLATLRAAKPTAVP